LRRPFPVILGHEGAGGVEALGPGLTAVETGDHVILNWAPDCGHCFYCNNAQPALCETFAPVRRSGTMLDGSTRFRLRGERVSQFSTLSTFAEYCIAPQEACIAIRKDIPLDIAALVGCAVTTGVGAVSNTATVGHGESVAVYGCGGVGLNILQGAALVGAHPIIAIDQAPAKMDIARQFGATHTLLADADVEKRIRALTGNRGADYAFEAIGLTQVQEQAMQAVRPGGALVIVGVAPIDSKGLFRPLKCTCVKNASWVASTARPIPAAFSPVSWICIEQASSNSTNSFHSAIASTRPTRPMPIYSPVMTPRRHRLRRSMSHVHIRLFGF